MWLFEAAYSPFLQFLRALGVQASFSQMFALLFQLTQLWATWTPAGDRLRRKPFEDSDVCNQQHEHSASVNVVLLSPSSQSQEASPARNMWLANWAQNWSPVQCEQSKDPLRFRQISQKKSFSMKHVKVTWWQMCSERVKQELSTPATQSWIPRGFVEL